MAMEMEDGDKRVLSEASASNDSEASEFGSPRSPSIQAENPHLDPGLPHPLVPPLVPDTPPLAHEASDPPQIDGPQVVDPETAPPGSHHLDAVRQGPTDPKTERVAEPGPFIHPAVADTPEPASRSLDQPHIFPDMDVFSKDKAENLLPESKIISDIKHPESPPSVRKEKVLPAKLPEKKFPIIVSSTILQSVVIFFAILVAFFLSLRGNQITTFKPIKGAGEGLEDVSKILVNIHRIIEQIEELAKFSDHEPPSVTRIVYSDNDIAARKYIKSLMKDAGLQVTEDVVGNIFGRWEGSDKESSGAILTGSHTDAIPHSGKYDGVVGVIGAIAAISALKEAGFVPKRSIEIVMFTSEEPTRFGYGCLGSRLISNQKGFKDTILKAKDSNRISFSEAAKHAGYDRVTNENILRNVTVSSSHYSAFVELHIEQGPILERKGVGIGIVTHIAAPSTLKVVFKGDGGHAGGVLMNERNDAGLAGAELALAVESHVKKFGTNNTVGTTGSFHIFPGAVNSIPSEAHLEIDVRDIDEKRKRKVLSEIQKSAHSIAKRRNALLSVCNVINSDPPAEASPVIRKAIQASAKELKLSYIPIISRAYHDALFISRVSPMGMIFIPCYKGYSHRPDEFASEKDIANGVKVLALTLAKLSLQ